jgi:RNA polymerase sigma-70 factor, ECF subfamily
MEQPRTRPEELAAHWAKSQPQIAVFVASIVTNVHDVDDILQNVALVTARKFDQYDSQRSFVAWAIGIARNEILKYYEDRRATLLSAGAIERIAQACESEPIHGTDTASDRMQALRLCTERLKTRWRTVLEMHYLREMSPARIAQQLDMSQANVFVILHRVRVALRECVEQRLRQENL